MRGVDRRHLEYFLAIAEAGSFTRAATQLRIAQPSLSHTISSLEGELGVRLFERLGRGVRLTDAGAALVGPARRTLRSFSLAAGAVRGASGDGFGRITVVSNTLWAMDPLVRLMGELRQLRPAVEFTVTDPVNRSDALERVRSGAVDFALVDGTPPSGALSSQWLLDHELVAVLPPGAGGLPGPVEISDLVPLGLICTPEGTALREFLTGQLEAAGESPHVAVQTAHLATVIPLVLAGAGVAILPEGLAADASAKGAQVLRLARPLRASVVLIWRTGRLSEAAEHFLSVCRELCPAAEGGSGDRRGLSHT